MATEQFNQWLQRSTVGQRQQVIDVMVRIFKWRNGAVMALIVAAYGIGLFWPPQIVTEHVLMALIAGTVTQAGLVFAVMARHLFPQQSGPGGLTHAELPPPVSHPPHKKIVTQGRFYAEREKVPARRCALT